MGKKKLKRKIELLRSKVSYIESVMKDFEDIFYDVLNRLQQLEEPMSSLEESLWGGTPTEDSPYAPLESSGIRIVPPEDAYEHEPLCNEEGEFLGVIDSVAPEHTYKEVPSIDPAIRTEGPLDLDEPPSLKIYEGTVTLPGTTGTVEYPYTPPENKCSTEECNREVGFISLDHITETINELNTEKEA